MTGMKLTQEWVRKQLRKRRARKMILEMLCDRYKKICEENKMCFKNYEIHCYDSAKKEIIGDEDEHTDK